ncbi:MAG TPA: hypothetical protein VME44_08150 [Streptosporangiaceae bacterium]|nr:hypothetical protein [Streptosporangiaceae bacterium]
MITRTPVSDITEEARHVLAGCRAHDASARLIGGLAVALHHHTATPPALERTYADIDIVIGRKQGGQAKAALLELGYVPNDRFNALHGDRRLLFYDTANGRQLDVFVGTFSMCHTLDLSGRLSMLPDTLSIADLLLTKLQIVEVNRKDLLDAAQLLRNHQLSREDEAGLDELSLDRLCAVTSADWGWYTTLSDNLAKLTGFAQDTLAEPDHHAIIERAKAVEQAIGQAPKTLRWKARARLGRRSPWYELPEEVAGNVHG